MVDAQNSRARRFELGSLRRSLHIACADECAGAGSGIEAIARQMDRDREAAASSVGPPGSGRSVLESFPTMWGLSTG